MIGRRVFLSGLITAPAIVRFDSLMSLRGVQLTQPKSLVFGITFVMVSDLEGHVPGNWKMDVREMFV